MRLGIKPFLEEITSVIFEGEIGSSPWFLIPSKWSSILKLNYKVWITQQKHRKILGSPQEWPPDWQLNINNRNEDVHRCGHSTPEKCVCVHLNLEDWCLGVSDLPQQREQMFVQIVVLSSSCWASYPHSAVASTPSGLRISPTAKNLHDHGSYPRADEGWLSRQALNINFTLKETCAHTHTPQWENYSKPPAISKRLYIKEDLSQEKNQSILFHK